jgi:hypothetical protein
MHMLYNSENFAVVRFEFEPPAHPAGDVSASSSAVHAPRGGYEIVDKTVRREIFLDGALAERFQRGVQELVETGDATEEKFDAYIAGFAHLAQHPVVLH